MSNYETVLKSIKQTIASQSWWEIYNQNFFDPAAIALLWSYHKKHKNFSIELINSGCRDYLYRNGILKLLEASYTPHGKYNIHENDYIIEASQVIPTHEDSIINKIIFVLNKIFWDSGEEFIDTSSTLVSEMISNVIDHSEDLSNGIVTGQYFPGTKCLQIAVADHGIWILDSLKRAYSGLTTDEEAIRKSLEMGVTSWFLKSDKPYGRNLNAGLWLTVAMQAVHMNSWEMFVCSGNAICALKPEDSWVQNFVSIKKGYWQGTLVVFNFYIRDSLYYNYYDARNAVYQIGAHLGKSS